MALPVFSMRFRLLNRQLLLWTGRSRSYRSAISIRCKEIPNAIHENVFLHSTLKSSSPRVQSQEMFCTSAHGTKTDTQEFYLIYKFLGIRMLKAVSRLKLLQTGLVIAVLPPVYYFYLEGQIADITVALLTGITVFACAMLYSLTYWFQRIIGMIYVNQEATTLKISHLTFWGKRKDIYLPVKDVKPMSETGDRKGEVLIQVKRYSSPHILYLPIRFCQIVDKEKFSLLFGELK